MLGIYNDSFPQPMYDAEKEIGCRGEVKSCLGKFERAIETYSKICDEISELHEKSGKRKQELHRGITLYKRRRKVRCILNRTFSNLKYSKRNFFENP